MLVYVPYPMNEQVIEEAVLRFTTYARWYERTRQWC